MDNFFSFLLTFLLFQLYHLVLNKLKYNFLNYIELLFLILIEGLNIILIFDLLGNNNQIYFYHFLIQFLHDIIVVFQLELIEYLKFPF